MRPFLEWRIELDHDWGLAPGAHGRGLERLLPAGVWSELAGTYVGTDVEEYPHDVDAAVSAHLDRVRHLPRR